MNTRTRWLMYGLAACLISGAGLSVIAATGTIEPPAIKANATAPIRVVINYGDGSQRLFTRIAPSEGAKSFTVLDAMNQVIAHPHGMKCEITGHGDTAFVKSIDGQASETGKGGRAWQYWINERFGLESVGVATLKPGDRVTWVFEAYSDDPKLPRD